MSAATARNQNEFNLSSTQCKIWKSTTQITPVSFLATEVTGIEQDSQVSDWLEASEEKSVFSCRVIRICIHDKKHNLKTRNKSFEYFPVLTFFLEKVIK